VSGERAGTQEEQDTVTSRTSAIRVPFDVGTATKMSEDELRTELAVHLYQRQKLSLGKAKELAGLSVWQFLQLLGSRDIPLNYGVEQFEEDVATLKRLGHP
jgi:predicted HTH domain antitoxin